jgi:hypothetical protein
MSGTHTLTATVPEVARDASQTRFGAGARQVELADERGRTAVEFVRWAGSHLEHSAVRQCRGAEARLAAA